MKHSNFGENNPSAGDPPAYEPGPNGFLARAAAAGFEDDINALVTNYVLDDESRAQFRLLIDQYGLSGGDLATRVEPLQRKKKIAPGFLPRMPASSFGESRKHSKLIESTTRQALREIQTL